MTPNYLAKPLMPFPLPTKDGGMLRTIGDAGEYILALPQKRRRLAHWEQVRRLLMKETSVATVSHQVHLALSKDDKLDIFAFESITRARRCVAHVRGSYVPCVDGSELARAFFTLAALVGAAMCSA